MEKKALKNDTTREKLIISMSRYIKECAKRLDNSTFSVNVNISHENWHNRENGRSVWYFTRITIGRDEYNFYDKKISDGDFLIIVNTALKESNCKGKIDTRKSWVSNEYGHYYDIRVFNGLTLLGKPCKEFTTLNRMLKKYTGKELNETEVNTSDVCGKRSSWSVDENSRGYLCYQPKKCQTAIEFIRGKKTSRDTLTFKVTHNLDHGDDYDYKIAQYNESEWYGKEKNSLELSVNTPSGKEKGKLSVVAYTI